MPVDDIAFDSVQNTPRNPQLQHWEESEPVYGEYEQRDSVLSNKTDVDWARLTDIDGNGFDWPSRSPEKDIDQRAVDSDQDGDNYRDIKTIESLITKSGKPADIFNPFKKQKRTMKFDHKPIKSSSGNSARQGN